MSNPAFEAMQKLADEGVEFAQKYVQDHKRDAEMTLNEYQDAAYRTVNSELDSWQMEQHALHGMVGEIGELHSIYQKKFQGHGEDDVHKMKEVGDLLWFIAEYCTAMGWELQDVAKMNIEKLQERYPAKFEVSKSLYRKEGDI